MGVWDFQGSHSTRECIRVTRNCRDSEQETAVQHEVGQVVQSGEEGR
jgi:hypothetical protein